MKFGEFCKAMIKMSLIGPRLSFRAAEMMVATTQVFTSRMSVIAGAVRKPTVSAGVELNLMILEKIEATNEAMAAAVSFFARAKPWQPAALMASPTSRKLAKQNNSLWQAMMGTLSLLGWTVALPLKIILGAVDFFTEVTDPLHSRLLANARRLRAKKR